MQPLGQSSPGAPPQSPPAAVSQTVTSRQDPVSEPCCWLVQETSHERQQHRWHL
eukprot:CAMPEP_0194484700 /NCGR_PEP_ID=MMETSP0253-20130528/5956_1 /TAXON_ID=2966 /ORGANISM="Noctiluca scintillans" /LENGTH=53 /DNA_ID=CAMNT_0039324561 /DNA_START=412 /DNA_END=570 /DNA_ORIENTATION=+